MTAIATSDLTKIYDGIVAVDGINLTIERGEVFGFLGPNGAGKSTTIDMLLDFVRPTEGGSWILDTDPRTETATVRSRIGVLPEGYSLYNRLTARKHIKLARDLENSDDDPDTVLARVGLTDASDRPAGEFSKGMRQRLALGMALVGEPDLLILDEPSAGLDPNGVRMLREIIRTESERGATVFFSSHILEQVEAVCNRVAIMDEGRLAAVDTIDNLRDSLGPGSVLCLDVDEIPATTDLTAIDGIEAVAAEGSTLRIACSTTDVKADAIARVEATGSSVIDINVEQTSLEDLFTAYTTGETEETHG